MAMGRGSGNREGWACNDRTGLWWLGISQGSLMMGRWGRNSFRKREEGEGWVDELSSDGCESFCAFGSGSKCICILVSRRGMRIVRT